MKELNRRAFLTLTGAALAMMALTACGADERQGSQSIGSNQQVSWRTARAYAG